MSKFILCFGLKSTSYDIFVYSLKEILLFLVNVNKYQLELTLILE